METANNLRSEISGIPIFVDVERNIDGYPMIRCSYYAIQSDEPFGDVGLSFKDVHSSVLLLNLEAILTGSSSDPTKFHKQEDIDAMYEMVERNEALFVDMNDLWIPKPWFGETRLKQGMVFRISQDRFTLCWKFRNDRISAQELYLHVETPRKTKKRVRKRTPEVLFSESETQVFQKWTQRQIEQSRTRYKKHKKRALKKIIR